MKLLHYYSVGDWVKGNLLDTADTFTGLGGDLNVSCLSPAGTPGVSDKVVFFSVLGSVSDSGDGVVKGGSASAGIEDTTGVHLEDSSVGFDGNSNWSVGDGSLELVN